MRFVIADDHPLVVRGLKAMLEDVNHDVVGCAEDSTTMARLVEELRPDVVIADIYMPGPCVIEQCRFLRGTGRAFRLIILSGHFSDYNLVRALDLGAEGLLTKEAAPVEILKAIERVANGETYVETGLRERLRPSEGRERARVAVETLTPRERQILKQLATGTPIREVAKELEIALKTVDRHRTNIMNKLGCHSQVELVRYAIREGIVPP